MRAMGREETSALAEERSLPAIAAISTSGRASSGGIRSSMDARPTRVK